MTIVNNNYFRYAFSPNDKYINIPINITFDNEGREDGIIEYEKEILKDIINGIDDFETTKFANSTYPLLPNNTDINYIFSFFDPINTILSAPSTAWSDNYNNTGFFDNDNYYFSNSFKNKVGFCCLLCILGENANIFTLLYIYIVILGYYAFLLLNT